MTVSPTSEPDPTDDRSAPLQHRIGDAERDQAVGYLQEHMAQGRLDRDEFDERLTTALNAKTAGDLEPLFGDLPEPRPARNTAQAPFSPPPWSGASAVAVPSPVPPSAPVAPSATARDGMPRGAAIALAAVWPAAIILSVVTDFRFWWIWVVAAMVTMFVRRAFGPGSPQHPRVHGGDDGPRSLGH